MIIPSRRDRIFDFLRRLLLHSANAGTCPGQKGGVGLRTNLKPRSTVHLNVGQSRFESAEGSEVDTSRSTSYEKYPTSSTAPLRRTRSAPTIPHTIRSPLTTVLIKNHRPRDRPCARLSHARIRFSHIFTRGRCRCFVFRLFEHPVCSNRLSSETKSSSDKAEGQPDCLLTPISSATRARTCASSRGRTARSSSNRSDARNPREAAQQIPEVTRRDFRFRFRQPAGRLNQRAPYS